jgi:predicted small lipoprotein YifL
VGFGAGSFFYLHYLEETNMKKILALLLAMSMTVAMLAGCGAKEEAPVEAPAVEEEAPAEEVAEAPAEEAVVVDTGILKEADEKMLNTYSMIAVNPEAPFVDADGNAVADVAVNTAGADALIQWLLTDEALGLAAEYGKE